MINQTAERLWGAGLLMLSPARLIDRLLDRLEKLSGELMPLKPTTCCASRFESKRTSIKFNA